MKIYLYKDKTHDIYNQKAKIFPLVLIVGIYCAGSIEEADKLFENEHGYHPIKKVLIQCQIFTLTEFLGFVQQEANKQSHKIQKNQLEALNLSYELYGALNPSKKKQPDYMI